MKKHLAFFFLVLMASFHASAWVIKPFTTVEFEHLKQNNKPVLVHVHAVWCPTCSQQSLKLDRILSKNRYDELTILRVNFDTQKDIAKQLKVLQQSVLIMYKGKTEKVRSIGDTREDSIKSMIDIGT